MWYWIKSPNGVETDYNLTELKTALSNGKVSREWTARRYDQNLWVSINELLIEETEDRGDIPETSIEEFLYSVFFKLTTDGNQTAFAHTQFECQSEEFKALFEYEFGIFCLWTLSYFAKRREEFESVEHLGETICRALVRSLNDAFDVTPEELESLYKDTITRFEEMDSDMLSDSGLSNLTTGVANRVCKDRESEDFFKCMVLSSDSFPVLVNRHAQALQSVRIM